MVGVVFVGHNVDIYLMRLCSGVEGVDFAIVAEGKSLAVGTGREVAHRVAFEVGELDGFLTVERGIEDIEGAVLFA